MTPGTPSSCWPPYGRVAAAGRHTDTEQQTPSGSVIPSAGWGYCNTAEVVKQADKVPLRSLRPNAKDLANKLKYLGTLTSKHHGLACSTPVVKQEQSMCHTPIPALHGARLIGKQRHHGLYAVALSGQSVQGLLVKSCSL